MDTNVQIMNSTVVKVPAVPVLGFCFTITLTYTMHQCRHGHNMRRPYLVVFDQVSIRSVVLTHVKLARLV